MRSSSEMKRPVCVCMYNCICVCVRVCICGPKSASALVMASQNLRLYFDITVMLGLRSQTAPKDMVQCISYLSCNENLTISLSKLTVHWDMRLAVCRAQFDGNLEI